MGVNTNKQTPKVNPDKSNKPKVRFTLGKSEQGTDARYYEPAQYLSDIKIAKVESLFRNGKGLDPDPMTLEETEGKSLKVMYRTDTEVKFCGFVTAGDATIVLDDSDIASILDSARTGEIKKAIDADGLIALF